MIDYGNLYGLPTVAVRFFNVFGPKQNPASPYSGVISIITDCIREGKTFTLYGDGEQVRDFVYIDDVINALLLLTRGDKAAEAHGVYNIAAGKKTSVNDMIAAYEGITGKKLAVKQEAARQGDIKYSYADISKLAGLGYEPVYNIETGLKKYWDYGDNERDAEA